MSRRHASVLTCLLAGLVCGAGWSLEPKDSGGSYLSQKEFFKPELYISSSQAPLEEALPALPNRMAWENFLNARENAAKSPVRAFVDPRSGAATSLVGVFPLVPGNGAGNHVTWEQVENRLGRPVSAMDGKTVAEAARSFVLEHRPLLRIDATQLGEVRAVTVNPDLWQVSIPQTYHGIVVRHGRLVLSISHGNVVVFGTEIWGDVCGLSPKAKVTAAEALRAGFDYIGGRSDMDEILREATLEVIPVAPQEHQHGDAFAGPLGAGYRHRLAWTFLFRRLPDEANWEVLVDAHSGEVLAFQDINHYVNKQITGGVYPLASTEICPDVATCGTMQSGWPMPFADTGLPAPNDFTNSAGIFNYGGGTITTTLTGRYVGIVDVCGATANSSAIGDLNLGGINGQHDCASAGGSPGNTASSRSAFYEVNKIAEQARGWLPFNPWLQSRLTANVNRTPPPFCNAFYTQGDGAIHFYRSGGGCRNTGELTGVFDHEWGHGLDDNDANGLLSSSSEGYADIAAIYRLQTSCIGHGFWWTADKGCGQTADGTGFNANEAQFGAAHCDLNCSGVRDADWDKHADHTPDTALGFVCSSCSSGSGPCGKQVHCAAAPSRQAAWDLVARDLRSAPFNYDSQTAFLIGNKLFYQGSGNIGQWHSCSCGVSSDGCGATNAYMQWLTADDDNGNLNDGTPHMTAIYNAFNRHGIACSAPSPQNSGCSGGPAAAPTLHAILDSYQSALSWNATPGATRYWVFRTEGHAGCDYGKALIGETTSTTFTDSQVANGRSYRYNVVAVGSSPACFSPASNCATPVPPLKDADVLGQSVPSSMVAGQSYGVSVTLKNVGNVPWSPVGPQCGAYRLGSVNPVWGTSRVDLSTPVQPGEERTLSFSVTAPSTPSTYNFQWRMVHECVEWFGDPTPNVAVNVQTIAASFTYSCAGVACTFDASGSLAQHGIASYSWSFGDSGVGVGKTPSHIYSISGQYPVTLTVTDTTGTSASTTQNLLLVFADVPLNHWARKFIEAIYYYGITAGCAANPLRFCPDAQLTRAEIAVFLLRSKLGSNYQPPPATCSPLRFADVPCTLWAAAWIEELARRGITAGCGSGNYCPDGLVDRSQVAVFLLAMLMGPGYVPPAVNCSAPRFSDVPCTHWAAPWIEELARRGITAGCGPNFYCPADIVSRGMMAVFLVNTFNLSTAEKYAQILGQSVPSTMMAGQSYPVSMTLRNVGSRTWNPVGPQCNAYRLGPITSTNWGPGRVELPAILPPGQEVTLNFTVTAPTTPTTYDFRWGMVHECVEWFDDATDVAVAVSPSPPTARFSLSCSGLLCSFDASGSTDDVGIASYHWSFGDSTANGSGVTASHLYAGTGSYVVTLTVTDIHGSQSSTTKNASVNGDSPLPAENYFSVAPCRLVDTRTSTPLNSGQLYVFNVAGNCGIPAMAKAVSFNVGVVSATGPGHLVFFPGDQSSGPFANTTTNFLADPSPRFNNAILRLAINGAGTIALRSSINPSPGQLHFLLDVYGYFSEDTTPAAGAQGPFGYQTVTPCRLADTRTTASPLTHEVPRNFTVQGTCGVPLGAAVGMLNLVGVTPSEAGNLQMFRAGTPAPLMATLRWPAGTVAQANGARTQLAAFIPDVTAQFTGTTSTTSTSHVVLDVYGYFKSDAPLKYRPITPCRAVDTRIADQGAPALAKGVVRNFQIQGNCGVPVGAKAAMINVVSLEPPGSGWLIAYPSGTPEPLASLLNFHPNQGNLANGVILPLSTLADDLSIVARASGMHLIVDVFGYFQ